MKTAQQIHNQSPLKSKVEYEDGFIVLEKTVIFVHEGLKDLYPERTWINAKLVENDQEQNGYQDQAGKIDKQDSPLQKDDTKNTKLSEIHKRYSPLMKCKCHAVFIQDLSSSSTHKGISTSTALQPYSESMVNQNTFYGQIYCEPFQGNMSDQCVSCACKNCSMNFTDESGNSKPRRRSDASMMLGLILWNATYGFVNLKSIQLLFHRPIDSSNLEPRQSTSVASTHESKENLKTSNTCRPETCSDQSDCLFQASLAITLSLSFLSPDYDTLRHRHRGTKLPMPTQLLLSILQSDWKKFDASKKELKQLNDSENKDQFQPDVNRITFFPTELSLQQLYSRIESSFEKSSKPFETQLSNHDVNNKSSQSKSHCDLLSISPKILDGIATFLRAKSLNALRLCCKFLYEALKLVVPGLKLTLSEHQNTSLEWMRNREQPQLTEEQTLLLSNYHHLGCRKGFVDLHQCITAGSSVLLQRRTIGTDSDIEFLRVDAILGRKKKMLERNSSDNKKRINREINLVNFGKKTARGGMICDEPGLGKTITVLSLVLQTFGLSTELDDNHRNFRSIDDLDDGIFFAYWKSVAPYVRTQILSKILNQIRKEDGLSLCKKSISHIHCDSESSNKNELANFLQIKKNVSKDVYKENFYQFEKDMNVCFKNLLLSDVAPCNEVNRLLNTFRQLIEVMKKDQMEKKGSATLRNNDSISLLFKRKSEALKLKSLVPSSSTLIAVPNTLIQHWQEQIRLHIDSSALSKKIPIFYRHATTKKRSGSIFPGDGINSLNDVKKFMEEETHFPFLFIDDASDIDLPKPDILALFPIVLTSIQRISREWKSGCLEEELRLGSRGRSGPIRYSDESSESNESAKHNNVASPLIKVHWLRLVMDEGHNMGNSGRQNAVEVASKWIYAQRRWVMTGTPTPQKEGMNGLKNIWNLANFLQHEFFSAKFDGYKLWHSNLTRPWQNGDLVSFFRLRSFLSLLMVRHTKARHIKLPKPICKKTKLTMCAQEALTYNSLVSAVRANIIITSMNGKISSEEESMLHPSQSRHAHRAFNNIRLTCLGGFRIVTQLSEENKQETINLLKNKHGATPTSLIAVRNFLDQATRSEATSCMSCGIQLQTLLILPCAHLICTHCINNKTKECIICENNFDIDDFQRLQPGFETKFDEDEEYGSKKKKPKRKCKLCIFPTEFVDGECLVCYNEHECNLLNPHGECKICHRLAEDCPETEIKASYLIEKLTKLIKKRSDKQYCTQISDDTNNLFGNEDCSIHQARPLKVIVFSEFRRILNIVGSRLLKKFGAACIAEYWGEIRSKELEKFKSSECFCMLLTKDGSHGLDLSFVTNIFFLEVCWDKSLENQVIARANRMGATGNVEVEQLVAEDTIEKLMLSKNTNHSQFGGNLNEKYSIRSQDLSLEQNNSPLHDIQRKLNLARYKNAKHKKLQFFLTNLNVIKAKRNFDDICEAEDSSSTSKCQRVK